jgi:hypothetical protein
MANSLLYSPLLWCPYLEGASVKIVSNNKGELDMLKKSIWAVSIAALVCAQVGVTLAEPHPDTGPGCGVDRRYMESRAQ